MRSDRLWLPIMLVPFVGVSVRNAPMLVRMAGIARRLGRSLVGHNYVDLCTCNSAAAHLAPLKPRTHVQCRYSFLQRIKGDARIHKRAQQHVAAYTGKTLKISNSHRL